MHKNPLLTTSAQVFYHPFKCLVGHRYDVHVGISINILKSCNSLAAHLFGKYSSRISMSAPYLGWSTIVCRKCLGYMSGHVASSYNNCFHFLNMIHIYNR